ncbi:unnamed protein product, partial [Cladocopium goreaui]
MHICWCNAACHHQGSSHIRKRCGTCLRYCNYVSLPLVAVAALLHFPIAWLIQRLYRRTSFSEALDEYRKQIKCKPFPGPDGTHPRNQGLQVLTLRGLWMHFESFILERNMHFVVANIVRPLTQSKGVSFVSLWGGRQVDYFVSHSWGTSFPHFVCSIQCHALSKEGPTSWIDAAYWICSVANNQWRIETALGSDPMESAFALALTAGIKGVAMVMDPEAQPLTRVWCLFEFFLSSRQHLDLVFVTNAGVVGDDGCSSFDVALEMGKKIELLQVETCEASSQEDKKNIFQYIISELGSLERMDEQIRKLMAEMLTQNLTNMEKATGSLVDRLGQGSATDDRPGLYASARHQGPRRDGIGAAHNSNCRAGRRLVLPVTEKVQSLADFDVDAAFKLYGEHSHKKLDDMPRDAMMQLLLATFFFVFSLVAFAELHVWNRSTFTGLRLESPLAAANYPDCEVIGWAELCERKKMTAGSCFQLEPTVAAPPCELQGPHGAPAQLRPAAGEILTLTSGELRITGQIQMTSLRLQAKTLNFADANVEAWHEGPSDPNSTATGGGFLTKKGLRVSNGSVVSLENVAARRHGGGFFALGEVEIAGNSTVNISNSRAESGDGGGCYIHKGLNVSTGSRLVIWNAEAGNNGGGFLAKNKTLINSATVNIQHTTAQHAGGGFLAVEVAIDGMSTVRISNSSAKQGGGFHTDSYVEVTDGSFLNLENVAARSHGGGFFALGEVEIAGNSTVNISNSRAESGDGGGFDAEKGLNVSTGSRLIIWNAEAGQHGGGCCAQGRIVISSSTLSIQDATAQQLGGGLYAYDEIVIDRMSNVSIFSSIAEQGGGFHTNSYVEVTDGSFLNLENVAARSHGGAFVSLGEVEIAGNSTVNISSSRAESGDGGGCYSQKGLNVSTGSRLTIRNAEAQDGGGCYAQGRIVISSSTLSIQDATAQQLGGGLYAYDEIVIDRMSDVSIFSSIAEQGGGFHTNSYVEVTDGSFLNLENVAARSHGGAFVSLGEVEIAGNSTVNISSSRAESGHGGGCNAQGRIVISSSTLSIQDATAQQLGGGLYAYDEIVIDRMSDVSIFSSIAEQGGGFHTNSYVEVTDGSFLNLEDVTAGSHGGAFVSLGEVEIAGNSTVNISNSRAESGYGG